MHLLKPDKYKEVIIDSFKFLVKEKRTKVNVFALIAMRVSNHIHVIWQIQELFYAFEPPMLKFDFK